MENSKVIPDSILDYYLIKTKNNRYYVNAFVSRNNNPATDFSKYEIDISINYDPIYLLSVPIDQLENLSKDIAVKYIEIDKKQIQQNDYARVFSNVDYVHDSSFFQKLHW